MKLICTLALAVLIGAIPAFGQSVTTSAPAPTQTGLDFNVGGSAFGIGGSSAVPASDITLSLNPGFASKGYIQKVSLLSDNAMAPGIDWQYYGGGATGPIPVKLPASSSLSGLSLYWRGTAGLERIVPASGPSEMHVGAMVGGGANWTSSSGITVRLFEAGMIISPNAAWGNKAPYVAGGISYLFGRH